MNRVNFMRFGLKLQCFLVEGHCDLDFYYSDPDQSSLTNSYFTDSFRIICYV